MSHLPELRHEAPRDNEALRAGLYAGDLFLTDPVPQSARLAEAAREILHAHLGDDLRHAHERYSPEAFFELIGKARYELFMTPAYHALLFELIEAFGFDPAAVAFDPARIRVIQHDGHHNPRAQAVYYAHRDTWYGHPQSLITWWVPLDDLAPEETFVFYPERFAEPVPNSSEIFDYNDWVRDGWELKIGWQKLEAGEQAEYPGVTEVFDPGQTLGFACRAGQNLLFSGSHFHQTLEQSLGTTRYSLDFRIAHLGDVEADRGAPNVDNRSRGSALRDYIRFEA